MDGCIFRLRWRKLGGHVHCGVFSAPSLEHTWEKHGDLVFNEEEWQQFRGLLQLVGVEVVEEERVGY